MHDFQCKSPDEMKSQPFADRLKELKGFEEGGRKMGALYDYIYEEGREEGWEKGREEGLEKVEKKDWKKAEKKVGKKVEKKAWKKADFRHMPK
jgi:flagellar biosynthesis/type III secretory pathway protein FliH